MRAHLRPAGPVPALRCPLALPTSPLPFGCSMKVLSTINLASIHAAGLSQKTDLVDWVIIDYISDLLVNRSEMRRGETVFVNYHRLIAQVPILGIKSKSEAESRLHNLASIGLLNIDQGDDDGSFASIGVLAWEVRYGAPGSSVRSCTYCGATGVPLEMDHIIPKARGGDDSPENLTPACRPCNQSKGAMSLAEWSVTK